MQLDVVYCDRNEQTCVAVAVPIMFPYRCQNGETYEYSRQQRTSTLDRPLRSLMLVPFTDRF